MLYHLLLPLSFNEKKKLKVGANSSESTIAKIDLSGVMPRDIQAAWQDVNGGYLKDYIVNGKINKNLLGDLRRIVRNNFQKWPDKLNEVFDVYCPNTFNDKRRKTVALRWVIEAIARKRTSENIVNNLYIEKPPNGPYTLEIFAKKIKQACLAHIATSVRFKKFTKDEAKRWLYVRSWLIKEEDAKAAEALKNRRFLQDSERMYSKFNPRDIQEALKAGFACVLSRFGIPLLGRKKDKTYKTSTYSAREYPKAWKEVTDQYNSRERNSRERIYNNRTDRPFDNIWEIVNDSILSVMTTAGMMVSLIGTPGDGDRDEAKIEEDLIPNRKGGTELMSGMADGKFPSYKMKLGGKKVNLDLRYDPSYASEMNQGCFSYFALLLERYIKSKGLSHPAALSLLLPGCNLINFSTNYDKELNEIDNQTMSDIASMMVESLNMFVVRDSFSVYRANAQLGMKTNMKRVEQLKKDSESFFSRTNRSLGNLFSAVDKNPNPICPIFKMVWLKYIYGGDNPQDAATKKDHTFLKAVQEICKKINESVDWETCSDFGLDDTDEDASATTFAGKSIKELVNEKITYYMENRSEGCDRDILQLFLDEHSLFVLGKERYNAIQKMKGYYTHAEGQRVKDYLNYGMLVPSTFQFDTKPFAEAISKKDAFMIRQGGGQDKNLFYLGILVQQKRKTDDWTQVKAADASKKLESLMKSTAIGNGVNLTYSVMSTLTEDIAEICRNGIACTKAQIKRELMVNCYHCWSMMIGKTAWLIDTAMGLKTSYTNGVIGSVWTFLMRYNPDYRPIALAWVLYALGDASYRYLLGSQVSFSGALTGNLVATLGNPLFMAAVAVPALVSGAASTVMSVTKADEIYFAQMMEIAKKNNITAAMELDHQGITKRLFDRGIEFGLEYVGATQFSLVLEKMKGQICRSLAEGAEKIKKKALHGLFNWSSDKALRFMGFCAIGHLSLEALGFIPMLERIKTLTIGMGYFADRTFLMTGFAILTGIFAATGIWDKATVMSEEALEKKRLDVEQLKKDIKQLAKRIDLDDEPSEETTSEEELVKMQNKRKEDGIIGWIKGMPADFIRHFGFSSFWQKCYEGVKADTLGDVMPRVASWFSRSYWRNDWNTMSFIKSLIAIGATGGYFSGVFKTLRLGSMVGAVSLFFMNVAETAGTAVTGSNLSDYLYSAKKFGALTSLKYVTKHLRDRMPTDTCTAKNMNAFAGWYHLSQMSGVEGAIDDTGKNFISALVPLWFDECYQEIIKTKDSPLQKVGKWTLDQIYTFISASKSGNQKFWLKLDRCYDTLKAGEMAKAFDGFEAECLIDFTRFGINKEGLQAADTIYKAITELPKTVKLKCQGSEACINTGWATIKDATLKLPGVNENDAKEITTQFLGAENAPTTAKDMLFLVKNQTEGVAGGQRARAAAFIKATPSTNSHNIFLQDEAPDFDNAKEVAKDFADKIESSKNNGNIEVKSFITREGAQQTICYMITIYLRSYANKLEERWLTMAHSSYFSDLISQGDQVYCPKIEPDDINPYVWLNTKRKNQESEKQWIAHLRARDNTRKKLKNINMEEGRFTFNTRLVGTKVCNESLKDTYYGERNYATLFAADDDPEVGDESGGHGIVLTEDGFARVPGCQCVTPVTMS